MKKILSILIFFCAHTLHPVITPYQRDIPYELESLDQIRLTQQLLDFYHGMKDIVYHLQNTLFSSSAVLYNHIFPQHPYSNTGATVRAALQGELCQQEQQFLKLRNQRVKKQFEAMFNMQLRDDALPKIACCFSGGGFRAMIMTLGFLSAAQDIGLLDSVTYLSGLSGSTWAVAPWIASGMTLAKTQHIIAENIQSGIQHLTQPQDLHEILDIIRTKLMHSQIVSAVDIYGCLLAKTILSGLIANPHRVTISGTHAKVAQGKLPMPIYTAIQTKPRPYEWLEVTPFESGSSYLQGFVPTWAFGREFKHGNAQDTAPEQTLGYFMGIFGSAFEVSLKDVISMTASNLAQIKSEMPEFIATPLHQALKLILDTTLGDIRLFPAMLANYSYQVDYSPEKDKKMLEYVDAGIDFNLPLVPLLRPSRAVDLIIIYDASASVDGAPELKRAQAYARRKGIKLPPIDFDNINKQINIFKDEYDPTVPVIVYMPRIKNDHYDASFDPDECVEYDFCNTFNFDYSPQQFKLLAGLPAFTVQQHEQEIKQVIKDILVNKYNYALV